MKTGQIQPPGGPVKPNLNGGKVDGKPNVANLPGSTLQAKIKATQDGKNPHGKLPTK